ncbi:MAG: LysR family transcriptional regulator [Stellaceae bacterium]
MPTPRNLDIGMRDLRVLSVLSRERSLTHAAEILGTSQPSVSKVLARLRVHFDDPLFVWAGRAMQPTRRTLQIVKPLGGLLAAFDSLSVSAAPFDAAESDREFRLMLTDVGMIVFLPRLMARFRDTGHHLRLNAIPLDMRRFPMMLESGEVDLAVGDFPSAPRGLRRQRLFHDTFLSVVRRDHPRLRAITRDRGFLAERHILVRASHAGHAAHQAIGRALTAALPADRVQLQLPSFIASAVVAQQTDAIATMPAKLARFFADEFDLATFVPPLTLPRIEIAQLWHERAHGEPGHRWLRATIFSLFRE